MASFFQNVMTASFHGSIVILAVLLLRLVLRKTPRKFICYLWMLAGIRLLMPVPLQSRFSLQPPSISLPVSLSLPNIVPALWLLVAGIIAAYSAVSYFHLRSQVVDAVKVPGGWESDRIETAFVLGFFKPKIYIPTGMPEKTRQQILAHERTHLDKGDHWIKVIGFLALALHWFNPLVWVSYILLCKDIEMACDERVVQFMELDERKAYASALLKCSTNRVHYAACPVAFGEVSVKYRIKSALNYKKPGFWISLLGLLAVIFVAICLLTSPQEKVEVVVDHQEVLRENSHQKPVDITPVVKTPTMEPNPDWGITFFMDATAPTGGTVVYAVEERFAAVSEGMSMSDTALERWNGTDWESVGPISFGTWRIGFAQSRDTAVCYHESNVDWTTLYGSLEAGDYRIVQTITSDTDSAVFRAPFHIYREQLPTQEEAALNRCGAALEKLIGGSGYRVTLSETNPEGGVSPVKGITVSYGKERLDYYLGQFNTSTVVGEGDFYLTADWDAPFRLNQNRQFLFPEGQSKITQEEITFCSVWADYQGKVYRGTDTYRFFDNGVLKSADRLTERIDDQGNVVEASRIRMDAEPVNFFSTDEIFSGTENYAVEDSFDAQLNSPWGIFFRVDDDLLKPGSGEVWLATNAVGVSNYSTDGTYWLEKKVGSRWERLGGEGKEAVWADETISITGRTQIRVVDWTEDYGMLDSGVYRMGKRFYNGTESIIQYAEFAIYATGGVFGEGGQEALARVDAAIARLQNSTYRVEQWETSYWAYDDQTYLTRVYWHHGDTQITDYYQQEQYSHSGVHKVGDELFYGDWLKRSWVNDAYDCVYFADGYSVISDREISFGQCYSKSSSEPCTRYTYRFDDQGNIREIVVGYPRGTVRYTVTDTPEGEIAAYVQQKEAQP